MSLEGVTSEGTRRLPKDIVFGVVEKTVVRRLGSVARSQRTVAAVAWLGIRV
jgi:hypothetical protein